MSDRYLLSFISGEDVNGLYVVASKIPTLLTLVCTVFLTAWKTAAVVEDSGDGEEEKTRKSAFYGSIYKGFVAVLFCMGAGIVLFSKVFAKILFANDFYAAWQYIPAYTQSGNMRRGSIFRFSRSERCFIAFHASSEAYIS